MIYRSVVEAISMPRIPMVAEMLFLKKVNGNAAGRAISPCGISSWPFG
jgi:hypothetical protein